MTDTSNVAQSTIGSSPSPLVITSVTSKVHDLHLHPKPKPPKYRNLNAITKRNPTDTSRRAVEKLKFINQMDKFKKNRFPRKQTTSSDNDLIPPVVPDLQSKEQFPVLSIPEQVKVNSSQESPNDMDTDGFVAPKKTFRTKQHVNAETITPISNNFDVLSNASDMDDRQSLSSQHTISKPPAIFIYNINDKYHFGKTLSAVCQVKPIVRHASDYICFQAHNKADYEKLEAYCIQQNKQYSTTIAKKDRPLKVVIRKLPIDTPTQDIYQDLVDLEYPVIEVTQMHGRDKTTNEKILYPLFLASFHKEPNINEIYKLKYLLSYTVLVEPYKAPDILQCYQCQRLGHSQKTCHNLPRCVKCAGNHFAYLCPKKTRDEPAKCVNCGGDHPANFRGCKLLQTSINRRKQNNQQKNNVPVPPPTSSTSNAASNSNSYAQSTKNASPQEINTKKSQNFSRHPSATSQDTADNSEQSLGSSIKEVLDFFKGLNILNILNTIKEGLHRFCTAKGKYEKITVCIDILTNLIDDGTK